MQDRNVEFPNRFRMVKVEGTDDIYDVIPAPGEVISEGDTFSKQNMLPDHIPALLGLKMSNPQVKDILNVLANIGNVHVWAKSIEISEAIPESYKLEGEYTINLIGPYASGSATGTLDLSWTYASTVVVSNGVISMGPDKTTKQIATNKTGSLPSEIVGKFVEINGVIYYCPSTATMNTRLVVSYYTDIVGINGVVYVPAVSAGIHTEYLTSTDSTAYPEGTVDGVTTIYLGQLGNKVQIEAGSYVGTGTASADILVGFTPKVVLVTVRNSFMDDSGDRSAFILPGYPNEESVKRAEIIDGGFRVYYYGNSSIAYSSMLNYSGYVGKYIAIG